MLQERQNTLQRQIAESWLWPGTALVVMTLLAYLPALRAGFIWDDDAFLTNNLLVHRPDGLLRFWFSTDAPDYFPLTSTTLWLEWRLWGMNPLGYHVVNVLLHGMSAVLWWCVLTRLKLPGAWLAAAIFALHPVNVESVAWITERKNTLAMLFYALTLLWYLKAEAGEGSRWYVASVGAFFLALLSKTSVAPLPVVLVLYHWWRASVLNLNLEDSPKEIKIKNKIKKIALQLAPFFALSLVLGLITIWFQTQRAIGDEIIRADGFASRLAVAGCAVWFYLYKALVPVNLSFVYPKWEINPTSVLSYVPLVLLVVSFWMCWRFRERWGRGWLFGLGYFFVLLLPVLGFVDIYFMKYSLVADHWQYFALIAVVAAVAGALEFRLRLRNPQLRLAVYAVLLLMLGALTWRQSAEYRDEETLWHATLHRNPHCYLALNNLGNRLLEKKEPMAAVALLRKAVAAGPNFSEARYNLGNALAELGESEAALQCFLKAVELQPSNVPAQINSGGLFLKQGKAERAAFHFQAALLLQPDSAEACYNLGTAQLQLGLVTDAFKSFQRAAAIRPGYAAAHNNIGNLLFTGGKVTAAIVHFQLAVTNNPTDVGMRENLTKALLHENRLTEAAAQMEEMIKVRPQDPSIRNNLGNILIRLNRLHDAETHFRKAIELQPNYALAQQNLGGVLLDTRRLVESAERSRRALEIQPSLVAATKNLQDAAWLLATDADASVRNGSKALEAAQFLQRVEGTNNVGLIVTLAAAWAEAGQFTNAVVEAERALQLAASQTDSNLATNLQAQLLLYRSGKAYHKAGLR